jgi:hypothetical protein
MLLHPFGTLMAVCRTNFNFTLPSALGHTSCCFCLTIRITIHPLHAADNVLIVCFLIALILYLLNTNHDTSHDISSIPCHLRVSPTCSLKQWTHVFRPTVDRTSHLPSTQEKQVLYNLFGIRRVRKIAKSDYQLRNVSLSLSLSLPPSPTVCSSLRS